MEKIENDREINGPSLEFKADLISIYYPYFSPLTRPSKKVPFFISSSNNVNNQWNKIKLNVTQDTTK